MPSNEGDNGEDHLVPDTGMGGIYLYLFLRQRTKAPPLSHPPSNFSLK